LSTKTTTGDYKVNDKSPVSINTQALGHECRREEWGPCLS